MSILKNEGKLIKMSHKIGYKLGDENGERYQRSFVSTKFLPSSMGSLIILIFDKLHCIKVNVGLHRDDNIVRINDKTCYRG